MIHTIRTLTRVDLTAALDAADAPDLIDHVSTRNLSVWDGASVGQTALALEASQIKDLAVFLVAVATWLGPQDGARFADATTYYDAIGVAYWPGFVLDEPSPEQVADARNALAAVP